MKPVLALLLALALPAVAQEKTVEVTSGTGALLRGLDKANGQTVDIELLSGGGRAVFGLEVELADCRYPVNNPTGDAYAYLTIRDARSPDIRFQGWMIASAPALNALDHNRYDIWVLRCITS
ncbi:DUF2155 domain-containing protein [Seohaeicola zhoushanensis]|uniref:DUF2155 domain-containing protein n=1 Tax=Seohaeicola zhoushanensis TaxID=1569283 RepID=A0A8J3GWJ9_9RHOB|nr:DUF2155 domain-containing protein [Seohaeicola zhoushanensis]GHF49171.1 hypothetical protein GCM10017056_20970 [Seohaeicola zhoushanensis]